MSELRLFVIETLLLYGALLLALLAYVLRPYVEVDDQPTEPIEAVALYVGRHRLAVLP